MATTVGLRQMIDRKQWEMCTLLSSNTSWDAAGAASYQFDQLQLWMVGPSQIYLYDPKQDSFTTTVVSAISSYSNTNAQAGVLYHPSGPTGTASAGSSTSLATNLTLPGSLAGYTIRLTGGTGAGQERVILRNTYGANSAITVASSWTVTPDSTSTYLILSGRFWAMSAATVSLKYYDIATNTWSAALNVTGITAFGGTMSWTATPAFGNAVVTSTGTSATSTSITDSTKAWTASQFINYQVRITGGIGAGQVRTITANTGTALTVAAWTTTPDATSTYVVEPNDDYIYLGGNSAVTLFRYSISANTWSTLSPVAARTSTLVNGNLSFIGVTSDSSWADETNIKNCRYLYSFGSSSNLAAYDIAANTWINYQLAFGRGGNTTLVGAGVSYTTDREYIYIQQAVANTAPILMFRFNCVANNLEPYSQFNIPITGTALNSQQKLVVGTYTDGGTQIKWLYLWLASVGGGSTVMYRQMII